MGHLTVYVPHTLEGAEDSLRRQQVVNQNGDALLYRGAGTEKRGKFSRPRLWLHPAQMMLGDFKPAQYSRYAVTQVDNL